MKRTEEAFTVLRCFVLLILVMVLARLNKNPKYMSDILNGKENSVIEGRTTSTTINEISSTTSSSEEVKTTLALTTTKSVISAISLTTTLAFVELNVTSI